MQANEICIYVNSKISRWFFDGQQKNNYKQNKNEIKDLEGKIKLYKNIHCESVIIVIKNNKIKVSTD